MPRTLLRTVFNVNESFSFGVTKGYHEISHTASRMSDARICRGGNHSGGLERVGSGRAWNPGGLTKSPDAADAANRKEES
jgi:hypothetical protein